MANYHGYSPEIPYVNNNDKPGDAYRRLPDEIKDKLKTLSSDQVNKIRLDVVMPVVLYSESQRMTHASHRKQCAK